MNLFRSEEHVERWLETVAHEPGETISASTATELGRRWYETRLAPEWRPRPVEESQAILDSLGLTGPFWRLS